MEIRKPSLLAILVLFSFLYFAQPTTPIIVTNRLHTMKIRTHNMNIVNRTAFEAGGILALAEKENNRVVTSIDVLSPIRSATEPGSLSPNKNDTAHTKAKIIGGINGVTLVDERCLS
jgi:hypothetical protein